MSLRLEGASSALPVINYSCAFTSLPQDLRDKILLDLSSGGKIVLNELTKCHTIYEISKFLIKKSNIDTSLEVAGLISGKFEKSIALLEIFEALNKTGQIDRALDVAMSIQHDEEAKNIALCDISKTLAQTGQVEEALEIAKKITTKFDKREALAEIFEALIKADEADKAAEIAELAILI